MRSGLHGEKELSSPAGKEVIQKDSTCPTPEQWGGPAIEFCTACAGGAVDHSIWATLRSLVFSPVKTQGGMGSAPSLPSPWGAGQAAAGNPKMASGWPIDICLLMHITSTFRNFAITNVPKADLCVFHCNPKVKRVNLTHFKGSQ